MSSIVPPTDAVLSAFELRLSYGNHIVLENATIAICSREKIGLVGRNSGIKSSLLRIAAGQ